MSWMVRGGWYSWIDLENGSLAVTTQDVSGKETEVS